MPRRSASCAVFFEGFIAHLPHHIFTKRTDKAAEWQPVQGVIGAAERKQFDDTRRHTNTEFKNGDPYRFRGEEVT